MLKIEKHAEYAKIDVFSFIQGKKKETEKLLTCYQRNNTIKM